MWTIRHHVFEGMVEQARKELPRECCGLLGGLDENIDRRIGCRNALASERAFSVEPEELIAAFRTLRQEGRRLLGIYHSHPTGEGEPSLSDFSEHLYPEALCWIISFQEAAAVVRCFEWTDGGFAEVEFKLVK